VILKFSTTTTFLLDVGATRFRISSDVLVSVRGTLRATQKKVAQSAFDFYERSLVKKGRQTKRLWTIALKKLRKDN